MHIAVLDRERCHPKKCHHECQFFCPPVRSGTPTIAFPVENEQPVITEPLCIGCGICVHRCPFGAIKIVSVPDEMNKETFHQFGMNSFRLYSIPNIAPGKVTAILGPNGMGKTTTINILAGITVPNFGKYEETGSKDYVMERLSGTVMGDYFTALYTGEKKAVVKTQYVDLIPKAVKGKIGEILKKNDQTGNFDIVVSQLNLEGSLQKDVESCSGGELQKFAIATSLLKDADIYLMDEMSSYLDIRERVNVANTIQKLAAKKTVMIVEHDLAILDWMADNVHLVYGQSGVYGVIVDQKTTNRAINSFLSGYLREENVRIRNYSIDFQEKSQKRSSTGQTVISWMDLTKNLGDFTIHVNPGEIKSGQVIGVLGRNALGKTTLMKILAGVLKPDTGTLGENIKIAYKPQYISTDFDGTVEDLVLSSLKELAASGFVKNEILKPLDIEEMYSLNVSDLSGGELQRLSIALTLSRDADLYLMDEPSAHLDSVYRMAAAKIIRRVMEANKKSALIVDHDIYLIDLISDSLMVFSGTPGVSGSTFGPTDMKDGMNMFLSDLGITFRRDEMTRRPRINKLDSALDREQKTSGNYYYSS
ncbi:MAG: ribosome biogenesis/translation initiation ATPase RLI [Candidatus Thermoplasmatota archaeon]|nr:ribosome biogenesis/translation initiation ATPase RLI [Candidatus Thermoplasmatota archaeon]